MTFAQHNFSLQPSNAPDKQFSSMTAALDAVERMKTLGFDVKWIQELIGKSILKDQTGVAIGAAAEKQQPHDGSEKSRNG